MNSHFVKPLIFISSLIASFGAHAWTVSPNDSAISFVSIKKTNIGESHTFTEFSGSITDGKAHIIIKPDSIDTRVPIRNERMREFLFESEIYPTIEVTAEVDDILSGLKLGSTTTMPVPATLSMHGESQDITMVVRITKNSEESIVVTSVQPILVRAASFKMVDGIVKLSSLVNGLAIAESVPTSFSLMFKK
ncbi:YceI family protein [Arenicella sp. 4NH20-0111]|uniref:YceI family protein n=1 Tax=Arenicella sp. 4NH20-0111 TaxID=3127648 RepID=UPI0031027E4D